MHKNFLYDNLVKKMLSCTLKLDDFIKASKTVIEYYLKTYKGKVA